jgi:hypothetical protein
LNSRQQSAFSGQPGRLPLSGLTAMCELAIAQGGMETHFWLVADG